MVILFELVGLAVAADDHLVKVEGDAEGPEEVGDEEVVHPQGDEHTRSAVHVDPRLEGDEEGAETNDDCHAQVHDELDGVGPDFGSQRERHDGEEGAQDGQDHQHNRHIAERVNHSCVC